MKEDGWVGLSLCMHEMRNTYETLVEITKNKRSLGKSGCRWQTNVKMCVCVCVYVYIYIYIYACK